ncbi:MAG: acyl-CoA dehydrogenase family protein [Alkalispirochaeta sp.]
MDQAEPFTTFLNRFTETVRFLFRDRLDQNDQNLQRGIPPFILKEVLAQRPLDASIPLEHGGRGADPAEILAILEASAYESLPLSLMMGISGALFTEPMAKHADPAVAEPVFRRLRGEGALGGLMITEPGFGTDALNMRTNYRTTQEGYAIQGEKHWAGLTGWADYWIVTARRQHENGSLHRDIAFFFIDSRRPDQLIRVKEYYNNLGLYMIPYGHNELDLTVPENHRLSFDGSGVRLMQDLLHRSRMRFPGMALGFIRRNLDEAWEHCSTRLIGGKPLLQYDQVQRRLTQLQSWFTTAAAFCRDAAQRSGIHMNLVKEGLAANVHKAVMSDYMQRASQSLLQLVGAKGYRQDHFAGRATTDSRPFQIFEGSNDVIYQQIADGFLKPMNRGAETNLARFLATHPLTSGGIARVRDLFDFTLDHTMPQRRKVDLGQALSRVVAIQWNEELQAGGFDAKLVSRAVAQLREEVAILLGAFHFGHRDHATHQPVHGGSWLQTI